MKLTGIVQKVDELGRVILPVEVRKSMGIEEQDRIEVFVEGEKIILRKCQPACLFCNSTYEVFSFKGKMMCVECCTDMKLYYSP